MSTSLVNQGFCGRANQQGHGFHETCIPRRGIMILDLVGAEICRDSGESKAARAREVMKTKVRHTLLPQLFQDLEPALTPAACGCVLASLGLDPWGADEFG